MRNWNIFWANGFIHHCYNAIVAATLAVKVVIAAISSSIGSWHDVQISARHQATSPTPFSPSLMCHAPKPDTVGRISKPSLAWGLKQMSSVLPTSVVQLTVARSHSHTILFPFSFRTFCFGLTQIRRRILLLPLVVVGFIFLAFCAFFACCFCFCFLARFIAFYSSLSVRRCFCGDDVKPRQEKLSATLSHCHRRRRRGNKIEVKIVESSARLWDTR